LPALGRLSSGRGSVLAAVALWTLLATLGPASGQSSPATGGTEDPALRDAPGANELGYRVLLLYSEARLTPSVVSADRALRSTLQARSPRPVHFYTEFLDLNLFEGASLQGELRELLRQKYRKRSIDLIVAQGQLTVPIVLQNRAELFSGAPVVFLAVESSTFADLPVGVAVTGTWRRRGWGETLDLARRIHPGTRRAVVIVGSSTAERFWLEDARQQLAAYAGSIEVSYLVGLSFEDVLKEVAALQNGTVVLAGPLLRDRTGRDFATPEVITRMVAVARVPIYGLTEGIIGTGAVGGYVVSFEAHGMVAAELALRVLAGERPSPTADGTTFAMFDDRQVNRWGIDRRLLPPGSVVMFREPSLWELYRGYVVGAVGLLVVQGGLIGVLLVQRARRRRAEQSLAERLRFETILADLSAALSSCPAAETDRQIAIGLRRIVEDLGVDRASIWMLEDGAVGEARLTHSWVREGVPVPPAVLHESEVPRIFAELRQGHVSGLSPSGLSSDQAPIDRESLERFGTRSSAVVPLIARGSVVGGLAVGSVLADRVWPDELIPRLRLLAATFANALERQRAEHAADESAKDIRDLAGRLMTAQEEERRRIARDLHDMVSQEIAALSIALSTLEDRFPEGTPAGRRHEVARLQERTVKLGEAVRQLSHGLHPGILEYTGLAIALRSHCREFEREHGLAVTCGADGDLGPVPPDVALCLYRVTQEALNNAAKHAKASLVRVAVARNAADLVLTINDDGRGFDPLEARGGGGLGLISLEERVRLARGRLTIDTRPERGTEIRVVVPLP